MSALNLMFEVTQSCNCDCVFCYNVWKTGPDYPRGQLTFSQIKSLFDRALPGLPEPSMFLSGGEPLLREDLEQIVAYFKSRKLFVGVATNGLLLSEQRARTLVEAGVDQFDITLLSHHADEHDALTGCPGSHKRACEAISYVSRLPVNLSISFVATRQNIDRAAGVIDLGFKAGVRLFNFYRFVPTGRGRARAQDYLPTSEQLRSAVSALDKKAGELNVRVAMGIPVEPCLLESKPRNIRLTGCHAGLRKYTIDSLGNLRKCEQNDRILGSLFTSSMGMLALKEKIFGPKRPRPSKCAKCADKPVCRMGCQFLDAHPV